MSLLSQKHFNRSAKRNVSMMENHELKILNMFIKYMAYYSDTELTAFTDWIENNTKFELYQDILFSIRLFSLIIFSNWKSSICHGIVWVLSQYGFSNNM